LALCTGLLSRKITENNKPHPESSNAWRSS
jgi:hypothetical protein